MTCNVNGVLNLIKIIAILHKQRKGNAQISFTRKKIHKLNLRFKIDTTDSPSPTLHSYPVPKTLLQNKSTSNKDPPETTNQSTVEKILDPMSRRIIQNNDNTQQHFESEKQIFSLFKTV